MTGREMLWVLDKVRECVQIRSHKQCEKDCDHCSCHMDWSNMLEALDKIANLVSDFTRRSTKKDF